VTKKAVGLI